MAILKITQVRSSNERSQRQRRTLKALGLRRIRHTVEHNDTPQIRGMVRTVQHLVDVEEVEADASGEVPEEASVDASADEATEDTETHEDDEVHEGETHERTDA
jgi:large subunit ribosomal protein L30